MKKYLLSFLLIIILLILISAVIPQGCLYGSDTDWLSQHITLAETIRDTCLDQKTLLPSWISLGSGSSGYQFSYYGFLRPDIIIGCLFPNIPMICLVTGYMLFIFCFSVILFFIWLKAEKASPFLAFFGSILFMTAGCLFHMHRQIMFVNYLPFLLLSFLCIIKKQTRWLPLCMVLIILHSFYFSLSAFAAIGWYWYRREEKVFVRKYFLTQYVPCCLLSSLMAGALILPTALVLLEHKRSLSGMSLAAFVGMFLPNPSMNQILFNEYGMGLSFICLYAILTGLGFLRYRKDSILFLLLGLFGVFCWILNAGLYARPKILIPFMPLVLLHCIRVIKAFLSLRSPVRCPLWPFFFLFPIGLLWFSQKEFPWIIIDAAALFLFCLLQRTIFQTRKNIPAVRRLSYAVAALLLIPPVGLYLTTSSKENWVKSSESSAGFTDGKLSAFTPDPLYHFDSLVSPLIRGNEWRAGKAARSTMYSSVTNQKYSDLYYNTLMTPIRINNRVALLTSDNPFMLRLLGVRYIEATENTIPAGYHTILRSGSTVIAENNTVLPSVYFTSDVISEKWFKNHAPLEKLDLITRKTIIENPSGIDSPEKENAESFLSSYIPVLTASELPDGLEISPEEQGYEITATKNCTVEFSVANPVPDHIVLLQFGVKNLSGKAVVIDINNIRNKLSGAWAPYPNENTTFHYQFLSDSAQGVSQFSVTFSKGHYKLTDLRWNLYDVAAFTEKKYTPVKWNTPFSGTVEAEENGYLATSIPLQNGLQIIVDGKSAPITTVNTAFAGVFLEKGTHSVEIRFSPPGKNIGILISFLGLIIYAGHTVQKSITGKKV